MIKENIVDKAAVYIERYRNIPSMTSHRIARQVLSYVYNFMAKDTEELIITVPPDEDLDDNGKYIGNDPQFLEKPTPEEFLKSKGWDDKNPIVGGTFFDGIVELLEEYAKLRPYNPNAPRFPSEKEIKEMGDKYDNLEGPNRPSGKIYVYAGVNMVKEWLKEHGLL
jgi:hypothetical protein